MENKKYNPIAWFEIYVSDMQRATQFYETVLGVKLTDMAMPANQEFGNMQMKSFPGEIENAGAMGALVKMDPMPGQGSGNVIIYFGCEDCGVEESRVEAAGGKICQAKMSIGEYGFISLVSDTEGNTIGLYSMQ